MRLFNANRICPVRCRSGWQWNKAGMVGCRRGRTASVSPGNEAAAFWSEATERIADLSHCRTSVRQRSHWRRGVSVLAPQDAKKKFAFIQFIRDNLFDFFALVGKWSFQTRVSQGMRVFLFVFARSFRKLFADYEKRFLFAASLMQSCSYLTSNSHRLFFRFRMQCLFPIYRKESEVVLPGIGIVRESPQTGARYPDGHAALRIPPGSVICAIHRANNSYLNSEFSLRR